ncbi:MAG: crotonase/enoyl-CoA hydratase family protein [Proteobacteria bacterium]|nr:crotonase/enoyl-CoA hydratase family protein [Pseudomonadota bacterium]
MANDFATLKKEGDVSIITIHDGKANAFSLSMIEAINGCLADVPKDSGALVLTNRSGIFSGGFDLKTFSSGDAAAAKAMSIGGLTLFADLFSFPRPMVIACNGHAVALGAFMLLTADYRIGAAGDFRVWANEVGNKMVVPKAILEVTKIRLDPSHWYRAILHSQAYAVQDAVAAGYLDEVVPQDSLMDTALAKAEELAKLGHPYYEMTKTWAQAEVLQKIRGFIDEGR